jgi:predicted amidophosphoribosyltransferase
MRMSAVVRESLLDALALVVPVECAGCGRSDRSLCLACRRALVPAARRVTVPGVPIVWAGASYEGAVRGALLALKDGRTSLADPLASLLVAALRELRSEAPLDTAAGVELCRVPTSRGAFRRRGFDPVRVLARAADLDTRRVLRAAARHSDQKGLGRSERLRNLSDVHRARGWLGGRRFVIVDDIVTTGSTIRAVADALHAAGGHVIGAVAIAATPRTGHASEPLGRHPALDGDNGRSAHYGGRKGEKGTTA